MKRITISMPDELAAAVEREARRCRKSVSEIAREALESKLGLEDKRPRELPFANLGRSGYTTTARDAEEILQREWGDALGR